MSKYVSKIFVTVDVLVINKNTNEILLIKRLNEPYKDYWALPGGFVDENEDLEQAARRELFEETNVETSEMTQVGAFGKPNRDPRGHMVSVAYQTYLIENQIVKAKDDAKEIRWFSIKNLPELAFDHFEIINSIL
jgi:8-oxo-dGTP diphosphatase